VAALSGITTASFYDNPKVEQPPKGGSPLEELQAKWSSDWAFTGISTFAQ
jgi:hypothetical protein